MKKKQEKTKKKECKEPKFKSYSPGEVYAHWCKVWKRQAGEELKKVAILSRKI